MSANDGLPTLERIVGMEKAFAGKRVVVMGGSRGIGRATALAFASAGASVSICARNAGPL